MVVCLLECRKNWVQSPVLHAYNLSTLEVEAGGSKIQGRSWLHREFEASLSYSFKKKKAILIGGCSGPLSNLSTWEIETGRL